ncbi:MAG: Mov34/MPN/PAD-1 family protein [candidate division WOR-3 bacterium]
MELLLHASRSAYPNEFGAMIRGEGQRIRELLLLPGTIQGRGFASFRMDMLPMDSKAIGVAHSHPSGGNRPSGEDLRMFSKAGNVNLIVKYPYIGLDDVAAYDRNGKRQEIEVV